VFLSAPQPAYRLLAGCQSHTPGPGVCKVRDFMSFGKAVFAGIGAKILTGSVLGFFLVFFILYWLMGGF